MNILQSRISTTRANYKSQRRPSDGERSPKQRKAPGSEHDIEFDDLEIDMKGWERSKPTSHDTTRREHPARTQHSSQPYLTARSSNRSSHIMPDGWYFTALTTARPPTAKARPELDAGVMLDRINPSLTDQQLLTSYNKYNDPTYDPMRDSSHECHWGCDNPLPSIEKAYAHSVRAESRSKRHTI